MISEKKDRVMPKEGFRLFNENIYQDDSEVLLSRKKHRKK